MKTATAHAEQHVPELFPCIPVDPSGQKARPRFQLAETSGPTLPRLSYDGLTGCGETHFQQEFTFPAVSGETMTFAGASAIYEDSGFWFAIIPGIPSEVHYFGEVRGTAVCEFVALVRTVQDNPFLSSSIVASIDTTNLPQRQTRNRPASSVCGQ